MIAEPRSFKISAGAHLALLLIALFGLPVLLPTPPEPQPQVMTIDILPISEITNVRPSDKPIQEKKSAPVKVKPVKEPPKPAPTPPKPAPKVEQPKPEPIEKTFDPNADAEPVKEKKPEPKEAKPTPEKKDEKTLEQILKDLDTEAKEANPKSKDNVSQEENRTTSDAAFDASLPLSLSEEDAIKNAYLECWSFDAGGKDAAGLIVRMQVRYDPTGKVLEAQLDPKFRGRYGSDPFFRAAADAAKRALMLPACNPPKNLPPALYSKLGNRNITFDPRAMAQ